MIYKIDENSTENALPDSQNRKPLSRAQFLMWLGQQLNPTIPLYNMIQTFQIKGGINKNAFFEAWQMLVQQSDALRTTIQVNNNEPIQIVHSQFSANIEYLDFSLNPKPFSTYLDWQDERKTTVLALDNCLFDCVLIKLAAEDHIWYLCQHHLITDGQSFANVFRYMANYYSLALVDRLVEAQSIPQYSDYLEYEAEHLQSDDWQEAVSYWQKKITVEVSATDLYGRSAHDLSARTDRVPFHIDAVRSAKLREIAQSDEFASFSQDMSFYSVWATLFLVTLHRIGGQQVLRLGTPFQARPTPAFRETIGLFIEIGPLQVEIHEAETFTSLGEKVLAELFAGLMNAQAGTSSAGLNRSYDVLLNYVNAKFGDFAGLPVETDWIHTGYGDSNHAIRLQITDFDKSNEFKLYFDVNVEMFGQVERKWLLSQFDMVLNAFIDAHDRSIGSFSLMSPDEKTRLFQSFNKTDSSYPHERTVVELFEAQVQATPNAVAVSRGEQQLSYAELNTRANQLASFLQGKGLKPQDRVAICMERSVEVLIAIWGALKAGAAYVPIDPVYPEQRQSYTLADSDPFAVLTLGSGALKSSPSCLVIDLGEISTADRPVDNPDRAAKPEDLVYLIYTSGSTGKPKGTMLTHQGLNNYVSWAKTAYQGDAVLDFPLYSSLAFDLTVTSIFVPLISGGQVVVYGESDHIRGLEILDVFRDDKVDLVKLTPAHLELVEDLAKNCQRIRKLIVGGEDFKTDLALRIVKSFNNQVEIYNEYGPTEAVVGCMIHRFDPMVDTAISVPIGTPAANARIYLLDQYRQPVPVGALGEMFISSDGVARGYLNQPELTIKRFDDDPFRPGARLYQTGDVARWGRDGRLIFLGRRDDQVKINGARIELGEIQAKLISHPNINEAILHVVQYEKSATDAVLRFCIKCGLASNYPDVSFNEDDVCEFCTDFDCYRDDVFAYFKSEQDLDLIIEQAKEKATGDYDCMMLFSGGKDSSYVLSQLVAKGLRVLAWSLDNGFISEDAKENIRRITKQLNVDLVMATTPHMNAIFADSLQRFSNVCNGCYKAIYTLSMNVARQKGITYIFTGLSRGQLFETRLHELFRNRMFDVNQMDHAIAEARKVYHRVDDAVHRLLDVSMFSDDRIFDQIQFVDYFRYTDVELDEMYDFLSTRVPWIRPDDTGRSTNCLINEMGIHVHKSERGYHNYALPYSWDVRLGHKTREEAMEELDDDIHMPMVNQMMADVGYEIKYRHIDRTEKRLAAYFVADDSLTIASLRDFLAQELPDFMVPAYFVRMEQLPLTQNGKVDRAALPSPSDTPRELELTYSAPQSDVQRQVAAIWSQILNLKRVGIHDNFFYLGGNSVPSVQIVAKINRTFDIEFPLRSFFESPTVAQQSDIIEELVLADLDELSDEEIEALLAEMED